MSTDVADEIAADSETDTEETVPSRRLDFASKKVKIAALLLAVMAVQVAVAYLLIPQPALSHGKPESGEDPSQSPDPEQIDLNIDTAEVNIGTFSCTNNRASTGSIHVTFDLVAIVSAGQAANFERAADGIKGVHKHRVRQAVIKVARSSNREDLSDPNLSTMKRLIREEINKVLQKSFIIEVVISDFKTMEQ